MRLGVALCAAIVALGTGTPAGAVDELPDDAPERVRKCLQETEVGPLKACVQDLAKWGSILDSLNGLERKLIGACLADKSGDDLKDCLKRFAAADEKREKRREALDAATRTWEIVTSKSRMMDSDSVFLRIESDDEIASIGAAYRPILWLRCRENTTSVLISADWFLDDNVPVVYRLDQEKPIAQTWGRSDNYKTAGLWDGSRAIPLIKAMLGKQTMVVRVTPRNSGAKEMAFNIAGLDHFIDPLRKACKW